MYKHKKNGYSLSKQWFDFVKANHKKVTPYHGIIYFWIVEKNNRVQWKDQFGLPTMEAIKMTGMKDRRAYRKKLEDLDEWGLINIVHKSSNQYHATVVELNLIHEEEEMNLEPWGTTSDDSHEPIKSNKKLKQELSKLRRGFG
jgi:hypothetical protein